MAPKIPADKIPADSSGYKSYTSDAYLGFDEISKINAKIQKATRENEICRDDPSFRQIGRKPASPRPFPPYFLSPRSGGFYF